MTKMEELKKALGDLLPLVGVENVDKVTKTKDLLEEVNKEVTTTNEKLVSLTDKYLDLCHKVDFDTPSKEDNKQVEESHDLDYYVNEILNKENK